MNHSLVIVVPVSDASLSPGWDVDAIVRMFPTSPNVYNFGNADINFSTLPDSSHYQSIAIDDLSVPYDPLVGFMDGFDMEGGNV